MTFYEVVELLLDDEFGISGDAYRALYEYAEETNDKDVLDLLYHADATDDRFYTPNDDSDDSDE